MPFNEEAMGSIGVGDKEESLIGKYNGKEYLYHRSAL